MGTGRPALELELLRTLRSEPERTLEELAEAVGLPRTNYGRPLTRKLRQPVHDLVSAGLIEEDGRRYRLSERGRRLLADQALNQAPR